MARTMMVIVAAGAVGSAAFATTAGEVASPTQQDQPQVCNTVVGAEPGAKPYKLCINRAEWDGRRSRMRRTRTGSSAATRKCQERVFARGRCASRRPSGKISGCFSGRNSNGFKCRRREGTEDHPHSATIPK